MKKTLSFLFAALFLLLCLLPVSGMLLWGESEAGANEVLSPRPALKTRTGELNTEYLTDLSDYIADRFALRQEFITLWAKLNSSLFQTSVTENVLLGEDGWLYYAPTLPDYLGTDTMSARESWCAVRTLYLLQEYAESRGGDFLFTVAPNKNNLYSDNMPSYIPADGVKNRELLRTHAEDMGVRFLDLTNVFSEQTETLYFKTDSHWNAKGAALAADTILGALGRSSGYFASDFAAAEHRGDLYEMLYPAGTYTEPDFAYAPGFTFTYTSKSTDADSITLSTESGGEGSLLMYRDSFGRNLYPYLADSFGEATFSRKNDYDPTAMADGGTLVIELVERNLRYLNEYAPTLPAPERAVDLSSAAASDAVCTAKVAKTNLDGFVKITGNFAGDLPFYNSVVYIRCGDTVYEAVPTPTGFAATLPGNTETPPAAEVFLTSAQRKLIVLPVVYE